MDVAVGVFLALTTAVAWGGREVLLRRAFKETKPLDGLFATMAVTFVLSLVAAFFFESALWNRLTAVDVLLWSTIGMLHFPLAMTLYYHGIDSVGASKTSVVSNTSGILTPLLGMVLLSEPSSPNITAGVLATGAGIFVVSASDLSSGWRWQKQIGYGLFAGVIWSVTNILIRFGFGGLRLAATGLAIASGVPLFTLLSFLILWDKGTTFRELRRSRQLIGGSFLSAFGQLTLFAALSFAPTVYVVPIYSLKSLVTVFLAYTIIPKSESVNMRVILGAVMAIAGIVLINL